MKTKKHPSLRSAINLHCKSCIFDPLINGNWRRQVHDCTVTSCELYEVRPRSASRLVVDQNEEVEV